MKLLPNFLLTVARQVSDRNGVGIGKANMDSINIVESGT